MSAFSFQILYSWGHRYLYFNLQRNILKQFLSCKIWIEHLTELTSFTACPQMKRESRGNKQHKFLAWAIILRAARARSEAYWAARMIRAGEDTGKVKEEDPMRSCLLYINILDTSPISTPHSLALTCTFYNTSLLDNIDYFLPFHGGFVQQSASNCY